MTLKNSWQTVVNKYKSEKMFRRFGIELEIVGLSKEDAKLLLVMNGFSGWKVVDDFSVCGCGKKTCDRDDCLACEITSPILESEYDLERVKKLTALLKTAGAKTNHTCGFHVHVEAKNLSVQQCEQIYRRYAHFEGVIDLFHPEERRINNNNYCLSIRPVVRLWNDDKIEMRNKLQLAELVDKYYKLNLVSLQKFGTLEFRQHKGTIDCDEIVNWIRFCQEFIESTLTPVKNDSLFRGVNEATKSFYLKILEGK